MTNRQSCHEAVLCCGRFQLDLSRPRIMAVLNMTSDSFSGDGLLGRRDYALGQAQAAVEAGADILDIGGESSRPGAQPVDVQEEMDRVLPLVECLANWDVPVSVDTLKPEVMSAAISLGASMINDISGFREEAAVKAVAGSDVALCVMHMQGEPRTMQSAPQYGDVVSEVTRFLLEQVSLLKAAGVDASRLVVDPGFGFGKTLEHNLALLAGLPSLAEQGYPVLAGLSRKSMLGAITGRAVDERVTASVAAALLAAERGAAILRVHDVAETRDALAMLRAVTEVESRC